MTDQPTPAASRRRRLKLALAGAGLLGLGGAMGATAVATTRPAVTMAPVVPVAIRALTDDGIATIRGRVAEVYGGSFVVADATGRVLVDAGPHGARDVTATAGEPVTVQGQFERGVMHAAFLIGPDAKVRALGPLGRGPGGGHGRRHGPEGDERCGPEQAPTPLAPGKPAAGAQADAAPDAEG